MRKLYFIGALLLAGLFTTNNLSAQDFSNKGKDFWVCFPHHVPQNQGSPATLSIWITSDKASSGTITMPNGAFSATFNISANGLQEIQVPHSAAHISAAESGTIINKSIHILTDPGKPPVVAYAQLWGAVRSAATLLLPKNVLGKKYYATSFKPNGSGNNGSYIARSQFQIIATKPNTQVRITPKFDGVKQSSFIVTFPLEGDLYQYQAPDGFIDLTGTLIESIASPSGGCLPIAVFSGNSNISFGTKSCPSGFNGYDPLFQQQYPVSSWGKNFGFIPFGDYINPNPNPNDGNPYRVLASEDNTNVFIDGSLVATLNEGEIYPSAFISNPDVFRNPTNISADKPIAVIQYAQCQNCNSVGIGDPDMVILNPIEQNISDITIFSSSQENITRQWVNVLIKTAAAPSFKISFNGGPLLPPSGAWQNFTTLPGFSYLRQLLGAPGSYRLVADSGFNAIAYGFGDYESYAYSAGTNVIDLYQQIGVSTQYGIEPTPSVCKGSPFKFKVSLPYCADSILWDLTQLPGPPSPSTELVKYTQCAVGAGGPDSTTVVNGVTLYWYSLPTTYSFNTTGTFPVNMIVYKPNTDGCGSEDEIDFELNVYDQPTPDFNFTTGGCVAEPTMFTDNSVTPRPSYIWNWDFGDPGSGASNTSALQNPSHIFSAPGTYTVKFSTITTPGCVSTEVSKVVTAVPKPTATISGATSVCVNDPMPQVTFTASDGTAPYTFSYHINAGAAIHLNSPTNSITVSVPTGVGGTFRYYLDSVKNTGSSLCVTQYANEYVDVIVNENTGLALTAGSNTQSLCQNSAITDIVYTISGGGNNATAAGLPAGVTGTYNAGTFTISGSPTTPGTYNYSVTATGLCLPSTLTGVITVNPDANINLTTGNDAQEICLNSAITNISYSISGGGTGATVTGLPSGISGVFSGGVFTISGTATAAGTFNYTVTTTGTCVQKMATGTIIVNPLPTNNFNTVAPNCETRDIQFTDASVPNAGTITNWQWNFGDPPSGAANTSALQNPVHNFATAGTYNVSLVVTTDKGCVSTGAAIPVTVNLRPSAGFEIPEVCVGDPFAQFTDTSKVAAPDIVNAWAWNFGDPPSGAANASTLQNPVHTYTATGSYNVQLVAISDKGCTDTLVQPLFINGSNPAANFNLLNPNTLCSSDTVTIEEASSVTPGTITKVEIYWDNVNQPAVFDVDDFPATGKAYKHKYPTTPVTAVYTIRYRAYSGGICVDDKFRDITVNGTPVVQFNDMPAVCYDAAPFQITQASETGGVPGTGVFTGPGVSSSGIFDPVAAGIGTFNIKYTFTSSAAGCIDTMTKSITVLDTASAKFSFDPVACEKGAVSFNSTSSGIPASAGSITGWNWDFGDPSSGVNNTSTQQNPTHIFNAWGDYTVTLNVTTNNSCKSTDKTIPIHVNPLPRPDFSFNPNHCLPSANVMFTNLSTIPDGTEAAFTYVWDFGDPGSGANSSTGSNPSHIYNAVGPYNVQLQVISGVGCVDDTTIILNTIHPQPTGNFTVDKTDICVGDSFVFTDQSDPADGTTTDWTWNMDDGNTETQPSFSYTYTTEGEYDVNLYITNNYGCRSTVFTQRVTVNDYPTVTAGPDMYILEGGSDTINAIVTAINPTYLWTPNQYFLTSNTVKKPIVKGVEDITYTLTVTGRGGCVSTDQVFIKVLKGPEVPNIFSPNGDGIHDQWIIKYLDTYPECTVDIFNRYGQPIYHSVGYGQPWDGTINGKPVPIGTYYYIINPKNGRSILSGYVDVIR